MGRLSHYQPLLVADKDDDYEENNVYKADNGYVSLNFLSFFWNRLASLGNRVNLFLHAG